MLNYHRMEKVDFLFGQVICEAAEKWESETGYQVSVSSGFRTKEEQLALYLKGKSRTTNSAHMVGEAVDLAVIGRLKGKPFYITTAKHYTSLNAFIQKEAKDCGIAIFWGGWWPGLRDYGHWQLSTEEMVALALAPSPAKDGGARDSKPKLEIAHMR